jgi:hypothetical protein
MIKICKICGKEFNKPRKPKQITCSRSCRTKMIKTTHGFSKKPLYVVWNRIQAVCYNPIDTRYPRYGGRGVKCEWKSFEEFKNDVCESYQKHLDKFGKLNTTIERIDNNGNYCKNNFRWATRKEQSRNRSNGTKITYNGETHSITEWADILKMGKIKLWLRLNRYNWTIEKALTTV